MPAPRPAPSDDSIRRILRETRHIAMLGASDNPARPSHEVFKFLLDHGYAITPVNPAAVGKTLHGKPFVAALDAIEAPIDMVDIFRNSEAIPAIVDEILALPRLPKVIWMQLNVRDDAAAARAEARGITVIMDRCPKIEYQRLLG